MLNGGQRAVGGGGQDRYVIRPRPGDTGQKDAEAKNAGKQMAPFLQTLYYLGPKVLIKRWVLTSRETRRCERTREGGDERTAEGGAVNPPLIGSRGTPSRWEAAVNLRRNLYTSRSQKMQLFMISADRR